MTRLTIKTHEKKQVVDITREVNSVIADGGLSSGLCTVTCLHTTAAVSTGDLDPGTDRDMLDAFTTMIPDLDYRHPHDPTHAPDHILATLIGPSVSLPVDGSKLVLGTWQRVILFEFDGPRSRSLIVTLTGDV
jgi:secondary thiamine-phosphate synthase enzyme